MVSDAEIILSEVHENSVHAVVSFSTLSYIRDLKGALLGIHRVLKPIGVVVLDFPTPPVSGSGCLRPVSELSATSTITITPREVVSLIREDVDELVEGMSEAAKSVID